MVVSEQRDTRGSGIGIFLTLNVAKSTMEIPSPSFLKHPGSEKGEWKVFTHQKTSQHRRNVTGSTAQPHSLSDSRFLSPLAHGMGRTMRTQLTLAEAPGS